MNKWKKIAGTHPYFWFNTHIPWVVPPPSNSHHQDYYIFSRDPYKPSFATVTGRGDNPKFLPKKTPQKFPQVGHNHHSYCTRHRWDGGGLNVQTRQTPKKTVGGWLLMALCQSTWN